MRPIVAERRRSRHSGRDRRRNRLAGVFAVGLIAAGCGGAGTTDAPETQESPEGERASFSVGVGGSVEEFNGNVLSFLPDSLKVHPGDAVVFRNLETGEPHTVTLGTDAPTSETLPGGWFFDGGFGGPPRQDTSMPCFLETGLPPVAGECPPGQREPVPFDGTQSWFNSGVLVEEEDFTLQLADDIAPGAYPFVCLVHVAEMRGFINVVEPGQPADDPADVIAQAEEQLEREVNVLRPALDRSPEKNEVFAGLTEPRLIAWANVFRPEDVQIPVGGTVTWRAVGLHVIAFNAPESASPFYQRAPDGSLTENPMSGDSSGRFVEWNGKGLLTSGLMEGVPQSPAVFSVTFTRAGTYPYQCLVHFDMEGRVKVGG